VSKNRQLVVPAIAVGVLLIAIALVYWVDTADALPSFFPGHEAGSSHHHIKHGLAAFILGIGAFIFAWFQTGPATPTPAA
jgi:hypothetical protein